MRGVMSRISNPTEMYEKQLQDKQAEFSPNMGVWFIGLRWKYTRASLLTIVLPPEFEFWP